MPYAPPVEQNPDVDGTIDLTSHLTNTSLQTDCGEEGVRLLDELVGCHILSDHTGSRLSTQDVSGIMEQMSKVLAATFQAALDVPIHFQVSKMIPSELFAY